MRRRGGGARRRGRRQERQVRAGGRVTKSVLARAVLSDGARRQPGCGRHREMGEWGGLTEYGVMPASAFA